MNIRDAKEDYFADGLTEEMIAQPDQLQPAQLAVIARTSTIRYKGEIQKSILPDVQTHHSEDIRMPRVGKELRTRRAAAIAEYSFVYC